MIKTIKNIKRSVIKDLEVDFILALFLFNLPSSCTIYGVDVGHPKIWSNTHCKKADNYCEKAEELGGVLVDITNINERMQLEAKYEYLMKKCIIEMNRCYQNDKHVEDQLLDLEEESFDNEEEPIY